MAKHGPGAGCALRTGYWPTVVLASILKIAVVSLPRLRDARMPVPLATYIGLWTTMVLFACTRRSETDRFEVDPGNLLTIVRTFPEANAVDVAPDVRVDVCFSGFVDPRAIGSFDASLSSGHASFDLDVSLELFAWSHPQMADDPPSPTPSQPWCPGSVLSIRPLRPLSAGVLHRVRLRPSAVGWNGERLDVEQPGWTREGDITRYSLEFTVGLPGQHGDSSGTESSSGDETSGAESSSSDSGGGTGEIPTLTHLFEPGNVLDRSLGMCGCHVDGPDEHMLARARLDLSDPTIAYDGLVRSGTIGSTGFPLVSPGTASDSFLVHKLLRERDGSALWRVFGDPMPPDEPLAWEHMVAFAAWIEAGALP